jgi:hypothetical protein
MNHSCSIFSFGVPLTSSRLNPWFVVKPSNQPSESPLPFISKTSRQSRNGPSLVSATLFDSGVLFD